MHEALLATIGTPAGSRNPAEPPNRLSITPDAPGIALLGIPFAPVTLAGAVERIESLVASGRPHYVVTPNVDFLVQSRRDDELRQILINADLAVCDGTPVRWASRWLGNGLPERVAGSDLVPALIRVAVQKGYRLFFLGATPEANEAAVQRLQAQYPTINIAGHYSPPFRPLPEMDHDEIALQIRRARPDLLFVAFGCPKAEKWMARYGQKLDVPVTMGVGATIDFLAGRVKRAPLWMQRVGLEWAYRLAQEPRRLFRRYATDLCQFTVALASQWWCTRVPRTGSGLHSDPPRIRSDAEWRQITLPAQLDATFVQEHASLWEMITDRHCLLEASQVRSIDSTGAGLLLFLRKKLEDHGHCLVVHEPSAAVKRVLKSMRIEDRFVITYSGIEALESTSPPAKPMPVPRHAACGPPKHSRRLASPVRACGRSKAVASRPRRLRIGLSTSVIQQGKTGIAEYLFALLRALTPSTDQHQFVLFVLENDLPLFDFVRSHCEFVPVSERFRAPVNDIVWHQHTLPDLARQHRLDVLHVPSYRRLLWPKPCPLVATIHDLAAFHVPGKYDPKRMFYGRVLARWLARRQDAIIAVSQTTAHDINRFWKVPGESVTVIHHGIDHERFAPLPPPLAAAAVRERFGLEHPFFLYVARLEHPGKNHVRLIEAFERFKAATRLPWKLVLAGSDWHGAEVIHAAIEKSPWVRDISCLGFVPEPDLPVLYRAAGAFVFPSLYEGFGFPPLEAMACGCPVICSKRGALREVVDTAAVLIDPEDVARLTEELVQIATIEVVRRRLQEAGLKRAAQFNWSRTAEQTLEVYQRIAGRTRPSSAAPADLGPWSSA